MTNDNYESACKTLETYIVNAERVEKLLSLFDKVQCLMKLNKVDDALVTAILILTVIETNFSTCEFKKSVEKIEPNMESLFQNLICIADTKFLIFWLKCWIKLVKNSFSQKILFIKLEKFPFKY